MMLGWWDLCGSRKSHFRHAAGTLQCCSSPVDNFQVKKIKKFRFKIKEAKNQDYLSIFITTCILEDQIWNIFCQNTESPPNQSYFWTLSAVDLRKFLTGEIHHISSNSPDSNNTLLDIFSQEMQEIKSGNFEHSMVQFSAV